MDAIKQIQFWIDHCIMYEQHNGIILQLWVTIVNNNEDINDLVAIDWKLMDYTIIIFLNGSMDFNN